MSSFRVLVCGSRDYTDRDKLRTVLYQLRAKHGDDLLIISGGARGADELAREWAVDARVDHIILYAKWERHKRSAGPQRNKRMLVVGKPHLVVAFSKDFENSVGTANMVKQATRAKVRVERHE